ncbi:hypothetical protein BJ138DRAFT_1172111 [Hygrophoropsis aurantiaca]|uniref:Uncharacterized protein n=1 Tax=Hygrophoropsis aurantiaca TaxID=72124 RepID=A0ACB8AHD4_9AGAM|nr:hypothetical protein BJ138DRAFT_1172111 [Hygrophoropsis aurantiaca]
MAELDTSSKGPSGKPADKRTIVDLKNGKVVFKQKPMSFEKASETLQEIVGFRDMLEQHIQKQQPPLTSIPDEHKPLIAKLAHESDKSIAPLAKQIRAELLPTQDEDEDIQSHASASAALPLLVVEHAIKLIMNRNNYGLEGPLGFKLPSAVCIWRWEVKDAYRDWLPKSGREKAEVRLAERIQAKQDLTALFEGLPQNERDVILDPKGTGKLPTKDTNQAGVPTSATGPKPSTTEFKDAPKDTPKKAEELENDASESPAPKARPKKAADPEKLAKAKEKEEKKAAKVEKEKKQKEAQSKSRSLMANFFGKAKAPERESPVTDTNAVAGPSSVESDFAKTFKPFVLKKDAELAPINWFLEAGKRQLRHSSGTSHDDAIVVDGEPPVKTEELDVSMVDKTHSPQSMSAQEYLQSIVEFLIRPNSRRPMKRKSSALKIHHAHNTRDILSQLNEAEIAGDPSRVRYLLSILSNRKMLPAKVLIFHEDARPGYYGTWTRNSRIIGPRAPFARDVVARDYGYDSGEEWEEEPAGEADDVVDDVEDEDVDGDADSDLDSWLVDDDEIEEVGTPPELRDGSPFLPDLPIFPPKRKADKSEDKQPEKKRKVVLPLVPFAKGPCWEPAIGQCEYEPFKQYRIQLFNDTPYPIDPFTYVSVAAEERQTNNTNTTFLVPPLPQRLAAGTTDPSPSSLAAPSVPAKRMAAALTPKTTFPDIHLPVLFSKISSLATPNLTFIVESIHQELKAHRVKKNAIEAKVREIGEKSKDKKVWVVKDDIKALHGLSCT